MHSVEEHKTCIQTDQYTSIQTKQTDRAEYVRNALYVPALDVVARDLNHAHMRRQTDLHTNELHTMRINAYETESETK